MSAETDEFRSRLDLHQIIGFLWRRWKFIASITALVLVIGITVLMRVTPLQTEKAARVLFSLPRGGIL
jgi:polysaccharide biosynthesis transport protein